MLIVMRGPLLSMGYLQACKITHCGLTYGTLADVGLDLHEAVNVVPATCRGLDLSTAENPLAVWFTRIPEPETHELSRRDVPKSGSGQELGCGSVFAFYAQANR